ncbi:MULTISPECIES: DUF5685 family protein [unclassified Crossiella]|uniref:DUF5685 family protein n=1 Tax=unclassified Crossiella TaxID=2620835 RepID=UPI001FFEC012|nr:MULTISPECIES: DUF5685 family protein [unclassified Crossiella]MCK2239685.1 DUF5685 family protein [Crossiella sp. S99.2]MCK2252380.1 DUF5685 family protein [Crossiella sp. S99.1]
MFGIIRPCRHRLDESLRAAWWAHLCGLCLALRDDHGQVARTATNYDGLVISALVEAQQESGSKARRKAGPCPLRGMRGAEIANGEGARLAAVVSLVLASAKISDHVADRDGIFAARPVAGVARTLTARWAQRAGRTGTDLGFDTAVLLDAVHRQPELEAAAGLGSSVLAVTEPTETATGAAFAHTAVIAGRPHNMRPLGEAGRLFGRIVHLLDAVEDLEADRANGAWNPLLATGVDLAEARRLCDDAVLGVRLALKEADLTDQRLVHALLAHELEQAVRRIFAQADPQAPERPDSPNKHEAPETKGKQRGLILGCGVAALAFFTCQTCCASEYHDPWTGERKEGWCHRNDCCGDCGCNGCEQCCCQSCCDGCSCDC